MPGKDEKTKSESLTEKFGLGQHEKPVSQPSDAARDKGDAPVREKKARRTRTKHCPNHPDVELADTNEGVGICSIPECPYGPESLAAGTHPDMQPEED